MRQATPIKRTAVKSPTPKNRVETTLDKPAKSNGDFNQKVAETAYELFVARGCAHGHHVEDWLAAEKIVKNS